MPAAAGVPTATAQHVQQEAQRAQQPEPQQQLWQHFVVIGLPSSGLQTVAGDAGFLGTDAVYKPVFTDSLPPSSFDARCQLPPQLPTCCLPAGIDIILHQDLDRADLTSHTFACVLTEGDGKKLYASCLTFYDRVPSDLCAKHEDLLGAVALKAMCLLSRQPYLTSSEQVLRELYRIAFQQGSSVPLPDLIHSLLAVPCPRPEGPPLCLRLGGCQRLVLAPLPIGPPPGEVSLQPLLEVLKPDSLVGLFAAVLLEQRVLLRSRHPWLLTVVAEGIVRLMYPLTYQHVYIPLMPCSLTDYLEAPTPFLMGLHSSEPVDQRLLDALVVADLDTGTLTLPKDDALLHHCLGHPYMQALERRVRMLMQPSVSEADVVASAHTSSSSSSGSGGLGGADHQCHQQQQQQHQQQQQQDPWVEAARALGPGAGWGPSKQSLLLRVFMEFFWEVLRGHQRFLTLSSIDAERSSGSLGGLSLSRRDSAAVSGGGSISSSGGARALRAVLSLSGAPAGAVGGGQQGGRPSGLQLQAQCRAGMQALLDYHYALCRHKDPSLLQQVMQGQPFLCFLGEARQPAAGSAGGAGTQEEWLAAGERVLSSWRAAEEQLQRAHGAAAGVGAGATLCIPDTAPSPLMPPGGLVHKTFPPLILSEASERCAQGVKRRRANSSRAKHPSAGRRRAISELMGAPMDLRRKSPLPQGTSTDTSPPRLLRTNNSNNASNLELLTASPTGGAGPLAPPLAPGLPLPGLAKISNVSTASTNASLSEEYSAEAELVRRQTGMLVHLMQAATTAAAAATAAAGDGGGGGRGGGGGGPASSSSRGAPPASSSSSSGHGKGVLGGVSAAAVLRRHSSGGAGTSRTPLGADVLEAARQLLCIQTGGNGWFIVSRLKELLANPPAPLSDADGCGGGPASAGGGSAGGATAAAAAAAGTAAAAAGKKGAGAGSSSVKASSPQSGGSKARGGKLLGVALSGGSSTVSSKPSALSSLKVSHGVESFASAASAMASAISRNASGGKSKHHLHTSSGSTSGSPTNTAECSKVCSSAPSSTCGSAVNTAAAVPVLQHSASCRQHASSLSRDSAAAGASSGSSSAGSSPEKGPSTDASQGAAQEERRGSSEDASGGSSAERQGTGSTPPQLLEAAGAAAAVDSSKDGDAARAALPRQQQQREGDGRAEQQLPPEIFEVLGDMVNALVEVAAVKDDPRVVLSVLELAAAITSQPGGGPKRRLLSALAGNPALRTEWFWATAFNFAVSSTYLSTQDFVDISEVVATCLAQFAGYLGGVGISEPAAWVLLMQLSAEHLSHIGPLDPAALLSLRAALASHSRPPVAVPAGMAVDAPQDADSTAATITSTSSSSNKGCAAAEQAGEQRQGKAATGGMSDVAAALKACGIDADVLGGVPAAGDSSSDSREALTASSDGWFAQAEAAPAPAGSSAFVIPTPGAAGTTGSAGPEPPDAATGVAAGGSTSSSAGALSPAASTDASAPMPPRPMSPLNPAILSATQLCRAPVGAGLSPMASFTSTCASSPRGGGSAGSPRLPRSPGGREGSGSYARAGAKHLGRQATAASLGSGPASAVGAACAPAGAGSGPGDGQEGALIAAGREAGGMGAAPAAAALAVGGRGLREQGALQWAATHSTAVVAVAAHSYTAATVAEDGCFKVLDLSADAMRVAASMQLPAQHSAADGGHLPVVQLWQHGQRAGIGNARHQAVWVVDLVGGQASLELTGLGSSVSCLFPLHRNPDALLSGLSTGSVSSSSSSSSNASLAGAYLWDLRRPKKPAGSLDYVPEAGPSAAAVAAAGATATAAGSAAAAAAAGAPGILCLSVHEDGALAAAGLADGRVLVWDMRKPESPLSACRGHSGPVGRVAFLPAAASAASGLGRLPLLLSGSQDWTARLWDAETGAPRATCVGHGGGVTALQVAHGASGTRLVTGAADGTLGVWGLDGGLCGLLQPHAAPVLLLRQGGDTLLSGASDKSCHVWGLQQLVAGGGGSRSNAGRGGTTGGMPPSSSGGIDGPLVVTNDGNSMSSGRRRPLASQCKPALVGDMAFDPVGELLCCGHRDGIVSVWNCSFSGMGQ